MAGVAVALLAITGCQTTPKMPPPPKSASSSASETANDNQDSSGSKEKGAGDAATAGGGAAGSSGAAKRAETVDERRAAIDRRLDDSLGTFDATLRKEQESVAKEHDARQSPGGAGSASSNSSASPTAAAAGDKPGSSTTEVPQKDAESKGDRDRRSRSGRPGQNDQHSGDLKSDKAGAAADGSGTTGNGATAREIPDGSDDDVVARRLRKAAEQETDPELKDKLWKEYVEYKKGARA